MGYCDDPHAGIYGYIDRQTVSKAAQFLIATGTEQRRRKWHTATHSSSTRFVGFCGLHLLTVAYRYYNLVLANSRLAALAEFDHKEVQRVDKYYVAS